MNKIAIETETRAEVGKGANRRLRSEGLIPIILYGLKEKPVQLAINEHDFMKATNKIGDEFVMFTLDSEEAGLKNCLTILRDVQRDPVTEKIIHIDFLRVDLKQMIDVEVAIHGEGTPDGVRSGGILDQPLRTISLRCLPDDVPGQITMDITGIGFNESMHVSELDLGENVEIMTDPDEVIFSVVAPTEIEEEDEDEAEEGVEGAEGEEGEGAEGEEGEGAEGEDSGEEE